MKRVVDLQKTLHCTSDPQQVGRKRRKGADFFFSQNDLSEEEMPAHPKRLLPAFTRVDNPEPSTTLAYISQGSDIVTI
jgi:hypothetical protein